MLEEEHEDSSSGLSSDSSSAGDSHSGPIPLGSFGQNTSTIAPREGGIELKSRTRASLYIRETVKGKVNRWKALRLHIAVLPLNFWQKGKKGGGGGETKTGKLH